MLIDKSLEFAAATALDTSGTDTDLIGNVIDTGSVVRDLGVGVPLFWVLQVHTAVTSSGSATVDFKLASDAQAAIATDGSATVHLSTGAIAKATLVAGYTIIKALPFAPVAYERYLGLITTTAVAALTAGKVNSFITSDPQKWAAYPDAL